MQGMDLSTLMGGPNGATPPPTTGAWILGTVTATGPLRVQIDGDSSPVGTTPISLVQPTVGDRVWCQITEARQLVVIGVVGGSSPVSTTNSLVNVGTVFRTTSTSNSTSTFNILTLTLPQALTVTGYKFRIHAECNISPDTAGMFSELQLHIGAAATTGGTTIDGKYMDYRAVSRVISGSITTEYIYAETQNVSNMNIVFVDVPSGGGNLVSCTATRTAILTVDQVLP